MARSIARAVRGRQRDGDDLAALAGNRQGPVPAFQAQVLDIGAGGLRYPQPVQREQRDQRVLERRAEPRRPAAARRARCGPARRHGTHSPPAAAARAPPGNDPGVPPRPRTCRTRRWCTAAGCGGAARPLASRSRAKLSMPARRTANSARERARHQLVNWRRSSAYASRVRPRIAGQEPGEREPFDAGDGGLGRGAGSGWGGSGHRAPPGRAETQEAGPAAGPSD